jgi:hypothetical protein
MVVDVSRSDGGMAHGYHDLIKPTDHRSGRVKPRNSGLIVVINDKCPGVVMLSPQG